MLYTTFIIYLMCYACITEQYICLIVVQIEGKWSSCVAVGVTTCDPISFVFPQLNIASQKDAWSMRGCSIFINGKTTIKAYGQNLEQLSVGDRVGVKRTSAGALHFYVNGVDQGCADSMLPSRVWAVVDIYSRCVQISVVNHTN